MIVKKFGPLFGLLALFGVSLFGLIGEPPEPNYRAEPNITRHENSNTHDLLTVYPTSNKYDATLDKIIAWIEELFAKPTDFLLVIFNLLLARFTYLLYRATNGLFKETTRLRAIADEQRADFLRSIAAAEKSADAAFTSIGADRAWVCFDAFDAVPNTNGAFEGVAFNDAIVLAVCWRNRGRTPAFRIEMYRAYKLVEDLDDVMPHFDMAWENAEMNFPLGPDAIIKSAAVAIVDNDLQSLCEFNKRVIMYSAVRYFDSFNVNTARVSEVCLSIKFGGFATSPQGDRWPMWNARPIGPQNTVN